LVVIDLAVGGMGVELVEKRKKEILRSNNLKKRKKLKAIKNIIMTYRHKLEK
jgi:hypothetical protein